MGLDTSHDCWHGPYSMFMRWREMLNLLVMMDRMKACPDDPVVEKIRNMGSTREALVAAWEAGQYDDQSVPINVLMGHSDCDGEIAAEMCGPLADALEALLVRMPQRALYDMGRPATERFIAGLRLAAAAGEPVEFH